MGAWGVAPKAEANLPSGTRFQSDSEADGDEYSVPTYRMSMSDAIARAIANVNTAGGKFVLDTFQLSKMNEYCNSSS